MHITTIFMIFGCCIILLLFIPDIMPYCECCRKYKPRLFFRIHKSVSIRFGYAANRSVCRKCCTKYNIENYKDYKQYEAARRKSEISMLGKL